MRSTPLLLGGNSLPTSTYFILHLCLAVVFFPFWIYIANKWSEWNPHFKQWHYTSLFVTGVASIAVIAGITAGLYQSINSGACIAKTLQGCKQKGANVWCYDEGCCKYVDTFMPTPSNNPCKTLTGGTDACWLSFHEWENTTCRDVCVATSGDGCPSCESNVPSCQACMPSIAGCSCDWFDITGSGCCYECCTPENIVKAQQKGGTCS